MRESIDWKFTVFIEDFKADSGVLKYEHDIAIMVTLKTTSITIDFNDFHAFNPEFAKDFLNHPSKHFPIFNDILRSKVRCRDPDFAEQNTFQVIFNNFSMSPSIHNRRRYALKMVKLFIDKDGKMREVADELKITRREASRIVFKEIRYLLDIVKKRKTKRA